MVSFLVRLGRWLAPPEPCRERHWDVSDQIDLDDARLEIQRLLTERRPGPCPLQHCDARHWDEADQEFNDALQAQINDLRKDLESERLKDTPLAEVPATLLMRAKELNDGAEHAFPDGFGEARRHDVFARLMKEYPEVSKRLLSYSIELTLPPEVKDR